MDLMEDKLSILKLTTSLKRLKKENNYKERVTNSVLRLLKHKNN